MSKWLNWQPSGRQSSKTMEGKPSKITKSDSDGFDGTTPGDSRKIAADPARVPVVPSTVTSDASELQFSGKAANCKPTNPANILPVPHDRLETCAPTCYEVEPGKWIHQPWDGCKTWEDVIA